MPQLALQVEHFGLFHRYVLLSTKIGNVQCAAKGFHTKFFASGTIVFLRKRQGSTDYGESQVRVHARAEWEETRMARSVWPREFFSEASYPRSPKEGGQKKDASPCYMSLQLLTEK